MSDINQQDASHATAQEKLQQMQSQFGVAAADYVTSKVHATGQDLGWMVEAAALNGTEQVLDVATGGGHVAFALAPYAAEVVALDLTPEMLRVAQQEASKRHLANIRFLEGNALSLPCADASFDLVACRHAAHHFPDLQQGVREWARVLKSGGKLVLVDSMAPEEPEIDVFLNDIETLRDPSHVRNQRHSEWLSLLSEVGLTVSSTRQWGIVLDIPSWTQRMRTPVAVVEIIEQRLRSAPVATRERLHIEEKDGVLAFTLPTQLLVAVKASLTGVEHIVPRQ